MSESYNGFGLLSGVYQLPEPDPKLPLETEIKILGGTFVKSTVIPKGGIVAQHAHPYDHISVLTRGFIRAWKNGEPVGDFIAPFGLHIPAHAGHSFLALEESTILCVHDIATAEATEVEGG
ncbi:MAG: hypothetical protein JWL84_315 [Rhodospirillales bacterium]|jgi:quercetin dioxygenase-like cupin family protein|nr:hypothetical protein [Rhodospirillales bacterium]